jgi:hypothetical protein
MSEQYVRVLQRLSPCSVEHREDADWLENHGKQICQGSMEKQNCTKALCEWCAAKVENPQGSFHPTYRRLWCRECAK